MKTFKRLFSVLIVASLIVFSTCIPVLANSGMQAYSQNEVVSDAVSLASNGNYIYLARYTRSPKTYSIGRFNITKSSMLSLYIPNNRRQDWLMGSVIVRSLSGSVVAEYEFINGYNQYQDFDFKNISPGIYNISVYGAAYGTSQKADVYYMMH